MNNELEQILNEAGIQIPMTISERLIKLLDLQGTILMLGGEIDLHQCLMDSRERQGQEVTDKMEQNIERLRNTLRELKNDAVMQSLLLHEAAQREL